MDHFRAMRVFLRVAELGSLTAASEDLGYARGAASATVKELETYLGVRLLERTTRKLRLTEEGAHYAERARAILGEVQSLEADVGAAERVARGTLRVQMPPGLARKVVMPSLSRFVTAYPEIELQMLLRNNLPDFVDQRLDAAVFVGDLPDSGLSARTLGRIPFVTVAAPAYLARMGTPGHPGDLERHDCINILSSATGRPAAWLFRKEEEGIVQRPRARLSFEGSDAAVDAARAGLGIIQLAGYLVYEELKAGRLVQILRDWRAPAAEARLLHPRHRSKPKKLRVFEDFLVSLDAEVRRQWPPGRPAVSPSSPP